MFVQARWLVISRLVGLLVAPIAPQSALSATPPPTLRACIDERPWLPFTNPEPGPPGSMQVVVAKAAQKLGLTLIITALPWRRCQEEVRTGHQDAMIGAAFVPYNASIAAFPRRGERIDSHRALGRATILLLKRKDSAVTWDGHAFGGLAKPIGTAAGTLASADAVRATGASVDDGAATDERNLAKLLDRRVDMIAGYDDDLHRLVRGPVRSKVVFLPRPLVDSAYYLALSNKFSKEYPQTAELLWDGCAPK